MPGLVHCQRTILFLPTFSFNPSVICGSASDREEALGCPAVCNLVIWEGWKPNDYDRVCLTLPLHSACSHSHTANPGHRRCWFNPPTALGHQEEKKHLIF